MSKSPYFNLAKARALLGVLNAVLELGTAEKLDEGCPHFRLRAGTSAV